MSEVPHVHNAATSWEGVFDQGKLDAIANGLTADENHPKPSEVNCKRKAIDEIIDECGSDRVLEWIHAGQAHERMVAKLGPMLPPRQSAHIGDTVPATRLRGWWADTARADVEEVLPKAMEYSSLDLTTIGAGLVGVLPEDQVRTEAGIAFYILGKAARLTGAYGEGRTPSDDTWHDLVVYGMMGRHVRRFGYWGASK